jgi:hypothetical protein
MDPCGKSRLAEPPFCVGITALRTMGTATEGLVVMRAMVE